MASSEVDIVNIALVTHLGARSIASFNDDSKEAQLARTNYKETRDATLRAHPWNFASQRVQLTADADPPSWGFDFAYTQPTDCLRVFRVNGESRWNKWKAESGKILTDFESPISILYVYRNETVSRYDPEFVMALSYALALQWVEPLIKASNLKSEMAELYADALKSARGSDGQEGSPEEVDASSWLSVR